MGYALYEDRAARDYGVLRWAGYAVPAICDVAGCDEEINRGMGYRCETIYEYKYFDANGVEVGEDDDWETEKEVEEEGCQLHFCGAHEDHSTHADATPKPDVPAWSWWLLNARSWAKWRETYPEQVEWHQKNVEGYEPTQDQLDDLNDD
jgi:hypothetical protein